MTCTFSLALPHVSVVCADTRLNLDLENGGGFNDEGTLTIYNALGRIPVRDYDRKIRRYPGGWATGSGVYAIVSNCLTRLAASNARTPSTIDAVLRQAYQETSAQLQEERAVGEPLPKTAIVYVYNTTSAFRLGALSINDQIAVPASQQYYFTDPGDIESEVLAQANVMLQGMPIPAHQGELPQLIAHIARVFHLVYQASGTVSDLLDIAISLRTAPQIIGQFRLLESNPFLMQADSQQILTLLQQTT